MNDEKKAKSRPIRLKFYVWVLVLVWTGCIGISLTWNIILENKAIHEMVRTGAGFTYEKDVVYRRWNSELGGVYVGVSKKTPPNPYLKVPERDITTPSGRRLTLMNPAYMTRLVHELGQEAYGVKGHITSLAPIRPENAPDPWETQALQAFEQGANEFSSVEEIEGQDYLRLMRLLVTEKSCLKCHGIQGYKVGDIRGGISVSIPMAPFRELQRAHVLALVLGHGLFWIVGLVGIGIGTSRLSQQIRGRKRVEQELIKTHKLEAVGILAGGIAHDYNNLLSVIMGNIDLAQDDIKLEVGTSEFLKEAEKACLRAKEVSTQLITFSKGGTPLKKAGSIGDLVKETTSRVLTGSKVKAEFLIAHDLWRVNFDEGQMQYALKNLILNAVESMPDGGAIMLRAENLNIGSETPKRGLKLSEGTYVKISIRDQGAGIPEKHLTQIFDPYFSTKERGDQKGMGLGLAAVYSIINRHDGHITAESEVGSGATFHIYLPSITAEPAAERDHVNDQSSPIIPDLRSTSTIPPGRRPLRAGGVNHPSTIQRVLVMDDEEMIRKLAKQMLSLLGYDVELSQDGTEAIALYAQAMDHGRPFAMVILDLTNKGGMGGVETIRKLLEIDPEVKAIISSGYSNDPVMADFRDYGFCGVMAKPYTVGELKEVLDKSLG